MRVDRCFAFVDLCGFTAYADQEGDERVVVMLAKMRTTLRESSARRGVRVVKWLGDGAMLSSTMVDALSALVVELDHRLRETIPSLPIRAGLACGPVIMFEGDDYIGYPVNVAARLCSQALPHELLATAEVVSGRPPWVHAQPARSVTVRGLAHEIEACNLCLVDAGDDAVVDPVCGLTLPRALTWGEEADLRFCSEACQGSWRERADAVRTIS